VCDTLFEGVKCCGIFSGECTSGALFARSGVYETVLREKGVY